MANNAVLTAAAKLLADRHVVQSTGVTVTTATALADVINASVTVDGGIYRVEISYLWNYDATTSDFESQLLIDGAPLVNGDADAFLHKEESKDSANGGAQVPGTASGQRKCFHKAFENVALTPGAHTIQFQTAAETAGVEASVWNVDIIVQRTVL